MSPGFRLAGVHMAFLAFNLPQILLYFDGAEAGTDGGSGKWVYIGVAAVYAGVVATGKPSALFRALARLGVGRKAARIIVAAAALFTAPVALDGLGGSADALMLISAAIALALFLWAIVIALYGGEVATDGGANDPD